MKINVKQRIEWIYFRCSPVLGLVIYLWFVVYAAYKVNETVQICAKLNPILSLLPDCEEGRHCQTWSSGDKLGALDLNNCHNDDHRSDGAGHWRLGVAVKHQFSEGGSSQGDRGEPSTSIRGIFVQP